MKCSLFFEMQISDPTPKSEAQMSHDALDLTPRMWRDEPPNSAESGS